jgi:hypothetical protein
MPHHIFFLPLVDANSINDNVKRFLADIEAPLVSIEISTQSHIRSSYGFYDIASADPDRVATKVTRRIMAVSSGRVRIIARSR